MKPIILDDRTIQLFEVTFSGFHKRDQEAIFSRSMELYAERNNWWEMRDWLNEFCLGWNSKVPEVHQGECVSVCLNIVFATPDDLIAWKLRWF
jgi:hypothetical protein